MIDAGGPKNIVEAYKIASKAMSWEPQKKHAAFVKVIDFCENDKACKLNKSIKRDTLLFWAYDKCAQAKVETENLEEAVELWFRAIDLTENELIKIDIGDKILKNLEASRIAMSVKAKLILRTALVVEKACQNLGLQERALQMRRLQETAEFVVGSSKMKH